MRDRSKIEEILHYFNIESEIDSVYGNWVVAMNGDVVNYRYPFVILAIHLHDAEWIETMKDKVWFRQECENNLRKALDRANLLLNK